MLSREVVWRVSFSNGMVVGEGGGGRKGLVGEGEVVSLGGVLYVMLKNMGFILLKYKKLFSNFI